MTPCSLIETDVSEERISAVKTTVVWVVTMRRLYIRMQKFVAYLKAVFFSVLRVYEQLIYQAVHIPCRYVVDWETL